MVFCLAKQWKRRLFGNRCDGKSSSYCAGRLQTQLTATSWIHLRNQDSRAAEKSFVRNWMRLALLSVTFIFAIILGRSLITSECFAANVAVPSPFPNFVSYLPFGRSIPHQPTWFAYIGERSFQRQIQETFQS